MVSERNLTKEAAADAAGKRHLSHFTKDLGLPWARRAVGKSLGAATAALGPQEPDG